MKKSESVWEMAYRLLEPEMREGHRILMDALKESKDPEVMAMLRKGKRRRHVKKATH